MNSFVGIVRKVLEEDCKGAAVVIGKHVPRAVKLIMADPEANLIAVTRATNREMAQTLTRRSRALTGQTRKQGSFFGDLRLSYAIDVEERVVKETTSLTLEEFRRVMEIRRNQIVADQAHLSVLEHAAAHLEVIWEANPKMTFGQVERLYVQRQRNSMLPIAPPPPTHPTQPGAH